MQCFKDLGYGQLKIFKQIIMIRVILLQVSLYWEHVVPTHGLLIAVSQLHYELHTPVKEVRTKSYLSYR